MKTSRGVCNALGEHFVSEFADPFLIVLFVFYFLVLFYHVPISSVGEMP